MALTTSLKKHLAGAFSAAAKKAAANVPPKNPALATMMNGSLSSATIEELSKRNQFITPPGQQLPGMPGGPPTPTTGLMGPVGKVATQTPQVTPRQASDARNNERSRDLPPLTPKKKDATPTANGTPPTPRATPTGNADKQPVGEPSEPLTSADVIGLRNQRGGRTLPDDATTKKGDTPPPPKPGAIITHPDGRQEIVNEDGTRTPIGGNAPSQPGGGLTKEEVADRRNNPRDRELPDDATTSKDLGPMPTPVTELPPSSVGKFSGGGGGISGGGGRPPSGDPIQRRFGGGVLQQLMEAHKQHKAGAASQQPGGQLPGMPTGPAAPPPSQTPPPAESGGGGGQSLADFFAAHDAATAGQNTAQPPPSSGAAGNAQSPVNTVDFQRNTSVQDLLAQLQQRQAAQRASRESSKASAMNTIQNASQPGSGLFG